MASKGKFPVEIVLAAAIFLPLVIIGGGAMVLLRLDLSLGWLAVLPIVALAIGVFASRYTSSTDSDDPDTSATDQTGK